MNPTIIKLVRNFGANHVRKVQQSLRNAQARTSLLYSLYLSGKPYTLPNGKKVPLACARTSASRYSTPF